SPRILTFADREDLEAMRRDIKRVKKSADVVVIGIHWGLHFVPGALAMYEMEIGHAAIDAGADLVLGHHQHILKGIEVYEGKVIFHGLGNFAFDLAHGTGEAFPPRRKIVRQLYPGLIGQQPDYPRYPFPADARKTIIAKATISDKRIEKVSFLPCMINKESQPEVLTPEDKSFEDVASYLERISREAGFDTKCAVVGAEIVITS
ncbi:MAG: CapA family protein, partial [Candidatus Tectomicrobia bacterium]|nr:CapA family protein [Candidatus Tectomicrobia bacterium]